MNALWRHPWLRHLRLTFNLLLTPIYLWGVFVANGSLFTSDALLGYLTVHIFLYGGATAFNSYYDKDEGPVGGLLHPPPVDRGLLYFSLLVQALGLPLAFGVNLPFGVAWLLLFLVFTAYSHPSVRLKAEPTLALAAIGVGQGGLGFALGFFAVRPDPSSLASADALLGMLTTAFIVLGLYIVTQSYQTAEDRARGDCTLPALLGPRRALLIATGLLGAGGGAMLLYVAAHVGGGWTLVLALFFGLVGLSLLQWAVTFDERAITANFYRAMKTTSLSSLGLSLFILSRLV